MRQEQVTITYYKFSELSDKAKERARDWYREGNDFDAEYADYIIEDAKHIASLFGLEIKDVFYSGFSSQGDGAKCTGHYAHKAGALSAVKDHAPKDERLHRIVQAIVDIQKRNRYSLVAEISDSGRYQHAYCTDIDIAREDEREVSDADAAELSAALRDYMNWIYKALEREYDYQNSNEAVDESIEANEYEFNEEGKRI